MDNNYKYEFATFNQMLNKLQAYAKNPDDDNIRIKEQIKDIFLHSPELLYALNDKELENELFDENGTLNVDDNGEPIGEWDLYFGENGHIRPFLFIPQTQDKVSHYVCYGTSSSSQTGFNAEKHFIVTFNIFVDGLDPIDKKTGIPRHDLIASIIREKFAWIGLEIPTPVPSSDYEGIADKRYLVRTLEYSATLPNSLSKTSDNITSYRNKRW